MTKLIWANNKEKYGMKMESLENIEGGVERRKNNYFGMKNESAEDSGYWGIY